MSKKVLLWRISCSHQWFCRRQKARTRGLSRDPKRHGRGLHCRRKRIFGESEQLKRIFINKAKIISRLIHRNLVKFVGWCHEQRDEFLLVYEFMPNGSLDAHLFGKRRTLPRDVRYKIALGLAFSMETPSSASCTETSSLQMCCWTLISAPSSETLRTQTTALVGTFGYLAPDSMRVKGERPRSRTCTALELSH